MKSNELAHLPDYQSEVLPVDCQFDVEFQHTGITVLVNVIKFQIWSVNMVMSHHVPHNTIIYIYL